MEAKLSTVRHERDNRLPAGPWAIKELLDINHGNTYIDGYDLVDAQGNVLAEYCDADELTRAVIASAWDMYHVLQVIDPELLETILQAKKGKE